MRFGTRFIIPAVTSFFGLLGRSLRPFGRALHRIALESTPAHAPQFHREHLPVCRNGHLPRRGGRAMLREMRSDYARSLEGSGLNRAQRRALAQGIRSE